MGGVDGGRVWPLIVHRSVLKIRHGEGRDVAGWLAGCIHRIVEPNQACGGQTQDREYSEASRPFLGLRETVGGGWHRARHTHRLSFSLFFFIFFFYFIFFPGGSSASCAFSTLLHGSRRPGRTRKAMGGAAVVLHPPCLATGQNLVRTGGCE